MEPERGAPSPNSGNSIVGRLRNLAEKVESNFQKSAQSQPVDTGGDERCICPSFRCGVGFLFSEDGINGCKHICFCMHEWKGAYKQKCMLKFVDASSKVTKKIKTVLLTGITQHPHFLFLPQLFSTTGSSLNLQGLLRVKGFYPLWVWIIWQLRTKKLRVFWLII